MYLYLGNEITINSEDIIGIFDLDNCTVSKNARDWLNNKEHEKKTVSVSYDLPKSFIVCDDKNEEKIYICQFTSNVLLKRAEQNQI